MLTYNLIFARVTPKSQVDGRPYRFAAIFGASIGIASVILMMVTVSLLFSLLPRETLGQSAATSLSNLGAVGTLFLAVLMIPLWETFVGQLVPLELAKRIGLSETKCIAVGSIVFAIGHFFNGGLAHGISAAIGGALFSIGYMAMRPWGYLPAFWSSYIAHALNNFLALFVVPLLFPGLA